VTEHKEFTVPVTREEVRVERVAAPPGTEPGPGAFQESTVTVPIVEEEVEIHKRPVVREEIRVTKTPHEEKERVSADVRKEKAEVRKEELPASQRSSPPSSHLHR